MLQGIARRAKVEQKGRLFFHYFYLPIWEKGNFQKLSEDPYGIFAVVLTPTRELAVQINEQVNT